MPPEVISARAAAEETGEDEPQQGGAATGRPAAPLPPRPPWAEAAEPEPEVDPPPAAGRRTAARSVPLPQRPPWARSDDAPPAEDPAAEEEAVPAGNGSAGAPSPGPGCRAFLASGIVVAEPAPGISVKPGCSLTEPVQLAAVFLEDGTRVNLKPAALLQCDMARAVADWIRGDLASGLASSSGRLAAVRVAGAYECRPRNRQPGAPMSEHGTGNAFDVGGFELASGAAMKVASGGLGSFAPAMKESACRRFTTVLGPGSDGFHEDHIHVDLARRNGGYRLCRWRLPGEARAQSARPGRARTASD